jgi:hypothetical protein
MSKTSLYALGMTLLVIVGGTLAVMFGWYVIAEIGNTIAKATTDEGGFRGFVVVMLIILLVRDILRGRP